MRRLVGDVLQPGPDLGRPGLAARADRLPILLKGILHPDDARRAVDAGVDGVIVSNHGGRQVDGAVASLDALPAVVEAVATACPVLFDGGIRPAPTSSRRWRWGRGRCCWAGPTLGPGASAASRACAHVLRGLLADLDLTLALSGHRAAAELSPDVLAGY